MTPPTRSPAHRLLCISGPIAAGKRSLAAAVATTLRERGVSVAVVSLDTVAEMALPMLPTWDWAHHAHARLVQAWLETEIDIVLCEGTETPEEVGRVIAGAGDHPVLHVLVDVSFESALARAQADPTRGQSRDPDFLRRMHDRFSHSRSDLPEGLRLDSDNGDTSTLAATVAAALLSSGKPD